MSTPDQRARDKDRDAAIEVVEATWADGQIVEVDRDKRVEELLRAQTLAEVQMLVHDLQPPAVATPVRPTPAPSAYPTLGQVRATSSPRYPAFLVVIAIVAVLGVFVAFIGGVVALIGSIQSGGDGGLFGGEEADVLSVEGYADLLGAIKEETGTTEAFSATLYPTYASVELPVDATSQRERYWYWDGGELTDNDIRRTSSWERTDLSRIDAAVLVDLVAQVRDKVEDETSWYAIVRAPDDDRAVMWVYATTDYGESVYLGARRDGTVVYDSTDYSS